MHYETVDTPSQSQITRYIHVLRGLVEAEGKETEVSEKDFRRVQCGLPYRPPHSIMHEISRIGLRASLLDKAQTYTCHLILMGKCVYDGNKKMIAEGRLLKKGQVVTMEDYDPSRWRRYLATRSNAWLSQYAHNGHVEMTSRQAEKTYALTGEEATSRVILGVFDDPLGMEPVGFLQKLMPLDHCDIERYREALADLLRAEGRTDVSQERLLTHVGHRSMHCGASDFRRELRRMEYRTALLDMVHACDYEAVLQGRIAATDDAFRKPERESYDGSLRIEDFDRERARRLRAGMKNQELEPYLPELALRPPSVGDGTRGGPDCIWDRVTPPGTVDQLLFSGKNSRAFTLHSAEILPMGDPAPDQTSWTESLQHRRDDARSRAAGP